MKQATSWAKQLPNVRVKNNSFTWVRVCCSSFLVFPGWPSFVQSDRIYIRDELRVANSKHWYQRSVMCLEIWFIVRGDLGDLGA